MLIAVSAKQNHFSCTGNANGIKTCAGAAVAATRLCVCLRVYSQQRRVDHVDHHSVSTSFSDSACENEEPLYLHHVTLVRHDCHNTHVLTHSTGLSTHWESPVAWERVRGAPVCTDARTHSFCPRQKWCLYWRNVFKRVVMCGCFHESQWWPTSTLQ